jgi:V/A-type H+-transporting ATPase subunit I
MIRFLEARTTKTETTVAAIAPEDLLNEVNDIQVSLTNLAQQMALVRKETAEVTPWGEFSTHRMHELASKGIKIRLFSCPLRSYEPTWAEDYPIFEISRSAGVIFFALIDTGEPLPEIDADEVKMPVHSLAQLDEKKSNLEKQVVEFNARLDEIAGTSIPLLRDYKYQLLQDAELDKTVETTVKDADDHLRILEGWAPADSTVALNSFLGQEGIFYITESPVPGDKVPVLLKNNKFSRKFEALGELYSLPAYNELDLTPFFAPFYTIFFGFCLGDAGYGVLITLAALFAKRKVGVQLKPIATLVAYLGLSTIVFGLISGTAFGINLYETNLPVYSQLQQMLKANNTDINNILFALALLLGGIQILFGMGIKAANETVQFGFKYALGTIGWIIILTGVAIIMGIKQYAGVPMETLNPFLYGILGIGGILVLFLNSPGKSIFLNFGLGLWNSYNMVTGVLGDLLSYIRLFALGISSAILGFVFNSLALSVSGSVIGVFFMVIILVIGHGINLFMASLGSFVHPMRLTFVEFYKNSGFAGGGRKYSPFRKLI